MKKQDVSKKTEDQLLKIAKQYIWAVEKRGDLETRDCDDEEFFEISAWSLKAALTAAYELGRASK